MDPIVAKDNAHASALAGSTELLVGGEFRAAHKVAAIRSHMAGGPRRAGSGREIAADAEDRMVALIAVLLSTARLAPRAALLLRPRGGQDASGWSVHRTEDGRTYYYHAATGTSSWEPPSAAAAGGAPTATDEWIAQTTSDGRTYYYNSATGESSWVAPTSVGAEAAPMSSELEAVAKSAVTGALDEVTAAAPAPPDPPSAAGSDDGPAEGAAMAAAAEASAEVASAVAGEVAGVEAAGEASGELPRKSPMARVAVLGLGKMGAGIARRLAERGTHVVLWNRTTERAREIAAEWPGLATVATSAAGACAAVGDGGLVITMLNDMRTWRAAIFDDEATRAGLAGRVVANLVSGNPDEGRDAARMAAQAHVSVYIDGCYCGGPAAARAGSGQLFLSCDGGEPAAMREYGPELSALGKVTFCGDVGASRALDYAVVDLYFANYLSFAASECAPLHRPHAHFTPA